MHKRFFYAEKFSFSHSSPFGHSGLLRSCEAIARLSHVGSRTKHPNNLCGDAIPTGKRAAAEALLLPDFA